MEATNINPKIAKLVYNVLTRKHGLQLHPQAMHLLCSALLDSPDHIIQQTLDMVASAYVTSLQNKESAGRAVIERENIEEIIQSITQKAKLHDVAVVQKRKHKDLSEDEDGIDGRSPKHREQSPLLASTVDGRYAEVRQHLHIFDAFQMPKWVFSPQVKLFVKCNDTLSLFSDASAEASAELDRYHILRQRILRHDRFAPPSIISARNKEFFSLTSIKSLIGASSSTNFLILGLLTQMEAGKYHLEDKDGFIELELSDKFEQTVGLFTLGCMVLVEGIIVGDSGSRRVSVSMIGMPPPETRKATISAFGSNIDFLKPSSELDDTLVLQGIEERFEDASLVFLSDVHLDNPEVLSKLRTLFEGYSTAIFPLAFVFFGNFNSVAYCATASAEGISRYRDGFTALESILAEFPELRDTSLFVFVPGPQDPWGSDILPRPTVPKSMCERLMNRVRNARFVSNPCRIRYCTQEIVLFREDLMKKLRRNCVVPPDFQQEPDMKVHLVKTLIDQAHLCPLSPQTRPTYWSYSHVFRLYPAPHLLVLADRQDAYSVDYEGCKAVNPGPFSSEFAFSVYFFSTKHVLESTIS
ncbi:DNA polymerase alpha/epsilon subunit B-domain-containing protein [Cladochytrium replicatum]|nr:DNA polymerase alpha/epsilon subunit B-domain-containing protein [Cladochytrium replicatum]